MSKAIAAAVVLLLAAGVGWFLWQQKAVKDREARREYLRRQQAAEAKARFLKALPALDLKDWRGRRPAELAQRFFTNAPALSACCRENAWSSFSVPNWHGWKVVELSFAEEGLRDALFEPACGLSEAECASIVKEKFRIELPPDRYAAKEEAHGYEGLGGPVHSVQFLNAASRGAGSAALLFLAPGQSPQRAFAPGAIHVVFDWYVGGGSDRRAYAPPSPW